MILLLCVFTLCAVKAQAAGTEDSFMDSDYDLSGEGQISKPEEGANSILNRNEVKGVWLSFGDYARLGLTISEGEEAYRKNAELFLTNMAQYGINTVYLHVRAFDDAFWKSSSFRASGYVGGDESLTAEEAYPFDPAGVFLEEAANLGISVHAWINPYRVSRSYYLDPADPGTLERIMTAVYELLDLGFDGIHMDDYFYHAPSGYISPGAPEKPYSLRISPEEKRAHVNDLVRLIYAAAHERDKEFGISPAGNYVNAMNNGADIDTWLSEPGYIDYLVPQIYWTNMFGSGGHTALFSERLNAFLDRRSNSDVKIYVGLALYRAGSQIPGDPGWHLSNTNIRDQVQELKVKECDGYVFFSASSFYEPVIQEELANYWEEYPE